MSTSLERAQLLPKLRHCQVVWSTAQLDCLDVSVAIRLIATLTLVTQCQMLESVIYSDTWASELKTSWDRSASDATANLSTYKTLIGGHADIAVRNPAKRSNLQV